MKVSIFAVQFPISLKIAANLKHIQKYAQMAHPGDLVLFPEGAISGYSSDLSFLDQIDQAELAAALDDLGQLAQNLGIHLWVGSLISEDGFWFNAACGFGPAGESYQYRKINLAHHERGILTPGNDLPIFDLLLADGPLTVGVQLCREIRYPEQWGWLARQGAQIILHLNNASGDEALLPVWRSHLVGHAAANQRFVISANNAAAQQICPTMVISPRGFVLDEIVSSAAGDFRCELDLDEVSNWYLDQARPDVVAINQPTQKERRRIARTMKMAKLAAELTEIEANPNLYAPGNFSLRTEALNFILMLDNLYAVRAKDRALQKLHQRAMTLRAQIETVNGQVFSQLRQQIQTGQVDGDQLRAQFAALTSYQPQNPHQPHYGYEDLDGLLSGVFFAEPIPSESQPREYGMVRYQPTPASVLLELIDQVRFTDRDVFYDLGSGLGLVVGLVNLLTGVRAVGIEFQESYYVYAQNVAQSLRLQSVQFIHADVRTVSLAEGTVFFLFNPFGGLIFDRVMEKLAAVAQLHPIKICSYGAATAPLMAQNWLKIANSETNHEFKLAIFESG